MMSLHSLKFLCCCLLLIGSSPALSQSFSGGWRVTGSLALQEQDRRLFGERAILAREILLNEEQTLSYDLAVGLHKSLLHRYDFRLDAGLVYRHEVNTFGRTYDHPYFIPGSTIQYDILKYVRRYQVQQLVIPLSVQYRLFGIGKSGMVFIGGSVEGSVHFAKTMRDVRGAWDSRIDIAPYSLEVNPGLGLKIGAWSGIVQYRAYQQRQIDPVIFYADIFPPWLYEEVPTGFETYNPTKIWLTVSRDLDWGRR